jgi:hypothetical protein
MDGNAEKTGPVTAEVTSTAFGGAMPSPRDRIARWRRAGRRRVRAWRAEPSPGRWSEAILSQETGSFAARALHLRVSDQGFFK